MTDEQRAREIAEQIEGELFHNTTYLGVVESSRVYDRSMIYDIVREALTLARQEGMEIAAKMMALTHREVDILLHAIQISTEDGSIYGTAISDADVKKINDELDVLDAKLRVRNYVAAAIRKEAGDAGRAAIEEAGHE